MRERLVRTVLGFTLGAVVAACGSGTEPVTVTAEVDLAPGEATLLSGDAIAGAVLFPAAGPAGAEYLAVAQLATGRADFSTAFSFAGHASVQRPLTAALRRRGPTVADRFDAMLRQREAVLAREAWRHAGLRAPAVRAAAPPALGSQRTFKVCANLACSTTTNVSATALFVGQQAAIYVDDAAPAGGFGSGDLAALGALFDDDLHPINRAAFGAESDIDANGVVIVLLTKQINALVPKPDCNEAFITGYFFGGDIAPGFATQYNNGEVFYGLVPDPGGTVSCAYSTTFVKRVLPITFIHEFQHMISFNQHVLVRGGAAETLWLNEALSHVAEELAGLHFDSLNDDTTASRFLIGNLYNLYSYLLDPPAQAVISEEPPGSLEMRGAAWSLVRYAVDRVGPTLTQALVQTSDVGVLNLQAAAQLPFETLLGHWVLALYLHDLPGLSAPPELTFDFWKLRTVYASLHDQSPQDFPLAFPLVPDAGIGGSVGITGTLRAGSGAFLAPEQTANGPAFQLLFRGAGGAALPPQGGGQLAVARIR